MKILVITKAHMLLQHVVSEHLIKAGCFGHEIMEGHLALLMLSVYEAREEEEGCEPKRGAQGNKDNNHWFGKLDGVHLVLRIVC